MATATTDKELSALFHEISQPTHGAQRSAKLQAFCEACWQRLDQSPAPPGFLVDGLVHLMQNDDDLQLARLVVADLRVNANTPVHALKAQIIRRIDPTRQSIMALEFDTQKAHEALYEEEKDKLLDSELYRACVLLHGHGRPSEEQKQRLKDWIEAYPRE